MWSETLTVIKGYANKTKWTRLWLNLAGSLTRVPLSPCSTPWAVRRWRWRWSRSLPAAMSPREEPSPTRAPWTSTRTSQSYRTTEGRGPGGPGCHRGPSPPRQHTQMGTEDCVFNSKGENVVIIHRERLLFVQWVLVYRRGPSTNIPNNNNKNDLYYEICFK